MSAMMRRSKLLNSRNRFLEDTGIHTFTGEEELNFPFIEEAIDLVEDGARRVAFVGITFYDHPMSFAPGLHHRIKKTRIRRTAFRFYLSPQVWIVISWSSEK
jgi:hypothetical protein